MNKAEIRAGLAPTPGYRYADECGNQLHVAGQVPLNTDGTLVGEGYPGAQARQCLDNLITLIRCHGYSQSDIRHLKIYVVGPRENLSTAWEAVLAHFSNDVPPATLLGVSVLGYENQLVEVDATIIRSE